MTSEYVTIGELVQLTRMRYSTLKHYTEQGMIPFEQLGQNLTRRYKRIETLERIEKIQSLKDLGLTIPEIIDELNKEN